MTTELDDIKGWISKIERDGNDRHKENSERIAVLEEGKKEQKERDEIMDKKMDMIIDILSQARGIITLLKVGGWIIACGSGLALMWEGFFHKGAH